MSTLPVAPLNELLRTSRADRANYVRIRDGLVLAAVTDKRRSLYSRLLGRPGINWTERLSGAEKMALSIIKPGSSFNMIFIRSEHTPSPDYQLPLGMTPLCWWPLDLPFIEAILFRRVQLLSVYNPAHLVESLRGAGLSVVFHGDTRCFEVTKNVRDRVMRLEGFTHFVDLVVRQFYPEQVLLDVINRLAEKMEGDDFPQNTRMEMLFHQGFL